MKKKEEERKSVKETRHVKETNEKCNKREGGSVREYTHTLSLSFSTQFNNIKSIQIN